MILECIFAKKAKHRREIKLTVIIHSDTLKIINEETQEQVIALVSDLVKYKITEDKNVKFQKSYIEIRKFWKTFLYGLPKYVLDNRIKKGKYKIVENLYLSVRESEKNKDQILEILFDS